MMFDTHVHLDLLPEPMSATAEATRARDLGIARFLVPGVRQESWHGLLETVEKVNGAFAAPGVHPLAADGWSRTAAARLESLVDRKEVVAIGEVGLDGSPGMPSAILQEQALRGQIALAAAAGLPLVLHCRRATGRLLEILRQEGASRTGGIWHGFSGSLETARAAMDLGFGLAFGGPLTWPGARRAPQVLQAVPEAWIVLESDAPDLAPHPHRREVNRPAYLTLVAEKVAALRGWSLQRTGRVTTANALRLLRIEGAAAIAEETPEQRF